jgi:hypothetical protein
MARAIKRLSCGRSEGVGEEVAELSDVSVLRELVDFAGYAVPRQIQGHDDVVISSSDLQGRNTIKVENALVADYSTSFTLPRVPFNNPNAVSA